MKTSDPESHERACGTGVTIERRQVLQWGGLLAAVPFLELPAARRRELYAGSFEAFTQVWRELTDDYLGGDEPLDDAYMYRLAGAIGGLELAEIPAMQRKAFENERITTGPAYIDGSIFIVRVRMEPGATIHPHNHPHHIVATTCLAGSCRYRHFEPLEETPDLADRETAFRIRESRSGVMVPGKTSHLTRSRDNMHTFEAGADGAVLVDFTIQRSTGGAFGMLAIQDEPLDAFAGTRTARWTEVEF